MAFFHGCLHYLGCAWRWLVAGIGAPLARVCRGLVRFGQRRWRRLALVAIACAIGGGGLAWWADSEVSRVAGPLMYSAAEELPRGRIALVLGTAPLRGDGRPNLFFVQRMRAAADLYHRGIVAGILVSGDNGRATYDEPTAMRDSLIDLGVSAEHITRDYAGFSTFESVIRARKVFDLTQVVVVSQRFHSERAVYLANAWGLDAVGFDAGSVGGAGGLRVRSREILARLRCIGDCHWWGRQPRFLGDIEAVARR